MHVPLQRLRPLPRSHLEFNLDRSDLRVKSTVGWICTCRYRRTGMLTMPLSYALKYLLVSREDATVGVRVSSKPWHWP